ncbi:hypothetical protein FBQ97_00065 [Acidobacteria bacterium ACD]|nr:MAG: hypothetical protein EDX89_05525 [Acidobacteriota bacterium]MCE7956475.1 hypothetical protein [Acidobacteria bacterium ACB2]MDL1948199.1 hypothetical protein [Acidobacteria bacterium ACD]
MRLDLAALRLSPAGQHLGIRPESWLRGSIQVGGVEHFLDLVSVRNDEQGFQQSFSRELDSMVRLHHLACGADGPFATVSYLRRPFVLFVTPSSR